jgi:hypothetical protein
VQTAVQAQWTAKLLLLLYVQHIYCSCYICSVRAFYSTVVTLVDYTCCNLNEQLTLFSAHVVYSCSSYCCHTNYLLFPELLFLMFAKSVLYEMQNDNLSFSWMCLFWTSTTPCLYIYSPFCLVTHFKSEVMLWCTNRHRSVLAFLVKTEILQLCHLSQKELTTVENASAWNLASDGASRRWWRCSVKWVSTLLVFINVLVRRHTCCILQAFVHWHLHKTASVFDKLMWSNQTDVLYSKWISMFVTVLSVRIYYEYRDYCALVTTFAVFTPFVFYTFEVMREDQHNAATVQETHDDTRYTRVCVCADRHSFAFRYYDNGSKLSMHSVIPRSSGFELAF